MENVTLEMQNTDQADCMFLKTRIVDLCENKHKNINEICQTMNISKNQLYGTHQGKYRIDQKFIIGALKAFPENNIGDLFYFTA